MRPSANHNPSRRTVQTFGVFFVPTPPPPTRRVFIGQSGLRTTDTARATTNGGDSAAIPYLVLHPAPEPHHPPQILPEPRQDSKSPPDCAGLGTPSGASRRRPRLSFGRDERREVVAHRLHVASQPRRRRRSMFALQAFLVESDISFAGLVTTTAVDAAGAAVAAPTMGRGQDP